MGYKIHLDSNSNDLTEVSFEELCRVKGISGKFRTASQERAARSRLQSTHIFRGGRTTEFDKLKRSYVITCQDLEVLAATNDIEGYVKAYRRVNHLTT